jgi:ABC-type phosphate transport system substrate-binding protein
MDAYVDPVRQNYLRSTIDGVCAIARRSSVRSGWFAAQCLVAVTLLVAAGRSPTARAVGTSAPASGPLTGKLVVGGSTALQPLVEAAARSFQTANPGVQIVVSDGGSSEGRSGVYQGSLDVGMSDVPLLSSEISSCADAIQTAVAWRRLSWQPT